MNPLNDNPDPNGNPVQNTRVIESRCLQNGTWTKVELNCVRDPAVPDAAVASSGSGHGHRGDGGDGGTAGGFLIGGNGGGVGGVGGRDGWTMLAVSVVVAVILGTAVAFLILFVRRW